MILTFLPLKCCELLSAWNDQVEETVMQNILAVFVLSVTLLLWGNAKNVELNDSDADALGLTDTSEIEVAGDLI